MFYSNIINWISNTIAKSSLKFHLNLILFDWSWKEDRTPTTLITSTRKQPFIQSYQIPTTSQPRWPPRTWRSRHHSQKFRSSALVNLLRRAFLPRWRILNFTQGTSVFRAGDSGAMFFCIHGAGHSALSFATLAR